MNSRSFNCMLVVGTTASGKTKLAVRLAHNLAGAIISIDSRQVYRRMNIGTGKDYAEYTVNGKNIPVHLLDVAEPGTEFHLHSFLQIFSNVYTQLQQKKVLPVLCGGTALYIQALLKEFEYTSVPVNDALRMQLATLPKDALMKHIEGLSTTSFSSKADLSTTRRIIRAIEISTFLHQHSLAKLSLPKLKPLVLGIDLPREIRRQRIEERLLNRLQNGLIDEVESLLNTGVGAAQLIRYGLEYKFIVEYLKRQVTYAEMQTQLTIAIQQFARRQMTWFRKFEREGLPIHWIDGTLPTAEQANIALNLVSSQTTHL